MFGAQQVIFYWGLRAYMQYAKQYVIWYGTIFFPGNTIDWLTKRPTRLCSNLVRSTNKREEWIHNTPWKMYISWCPTFCVRLKYVKSDCTWFKLSRIMHQNTWSSCATMIHHHMAVCKQPCDLWTWIAQAFLQRFCNGTGFLVGSHPHKQPFQLCQVPYLQVVRIWVLEGAHQFKL